MTRHEKIVVSAYTGVLMCEMTDLVDYFSEKLGYPVFDAELGSKDFLERTRSIIRDDFMAIVNS